MNRFEIYFSGRINRVGNKRKGKKKSRMIPRFLAAESMEVLFTWMGNSQGGADLQMGKIKGSGLAMLTKTSIWWWQ